MLPAVEDMDVTVLYCTTVAPFDGETLRETSQSTNIIMVEPYYEGVLTPDICAAMRYSPIRIEAIGVPHQLLTRYGTPGQHDEAIGVTPKGIRRKSSSFLRRGGDRAARALYQESRPLPLRGPKDEP